MARQWTPQDTKYFLPLLIERDGKQCFYCGVVVYLAEEILLNPCSKRERQLRDAQKKRQATVDHRIAVSQGGNEFDIANMVVACSVCNQKKGTRSPRSFKQK
ncbi:MAG: HNH endonuclease [bacterium]|nr:HNH endonuclease [bacterium]